VIAISKVRLITSLAAAMVVNKENEMNRTKDILIAVVCAVAVCATAIVGALILTRGLI